MTRVVFLAILSYLDSSGAPLECEAAVVCTQGEQSCHAHPIEQCPGNRDHKTGEAKGRWNMGQCLTAYVVVNGKRWDALGCSPDRFEIDVDAAAQPVQSQVHSVSKR